MDDASGMRLFECRGDLYSQPQGFVWRQRTSQRLTFYVFHHQIIRTDVIELADMRMIQSGDSTGFALESLGMLGLQPLDGHYAIQPCVASFPHLAHAALADGGKDFVRAKRVTGGERHVQGSV